MMRALLTLIFLTSFSPYLGFGQTYQVVKVDLKCESKAITGKINSDANDFSPFVYNNTLYFSSDRDPDIMLGGENNWSKINAVNIYKADLKGTINEDSKIRNLQILSERFYNGEHVGPACLSTTGDTIFLSRMGGEKGNGERPQLYYTVRLKNNKFTKLTALPFNNKDYSYGHPFYHSPSQRLYFASNKPGGKGGKDIYFSTLTDTGWTSPEALDEVNTAEDEMFPFIADNIFFYASNPNGQSGGLDIFWKILNGTPVSHKLEGLNSEKDDFGLFVFPGMTKGYYSSNRNGNDDLYYFNMERTITTRNEMAGEFKYKNLKGQASNIKVQIIDENNFVLYETTTDDEGNFVFREIDYDNTYSIKAIAEDDLELTLKDLSAQDAAELIGDDENVFSYRKIGADQTGTLSLIPDDMIDFSINEGHLTGQLIYEDEPGNFPSSMKVSLIDENGKEAFSTLTDEHGNFDFRKLSMSKNYILKVPEADSDLILLIYDLKGNVVAQLKTNEEGTFTYRKVNPDYSNNLKLAEEEEDVFELNDQTIWGYFEYENNKKLSRQNLIVSAYTENGELVSKEFTDEEGVFRFRNLPGEKSLLFKLEENGDNFILDDFTLYIFDRYGQKVAGLKRGQDGFFTYRPLGYDLDNELSQIEEDNLEFILGEQKSRDRILVYFDSNQSQVKNSDLKILNNLSDVLKKNPNARVEINAYADAKSSDEYNLILSKKRGDWIANYLSGKGIDNKRFIVNAYGESRIVDQENDALNRRAEIHVY